MTPSKAVELHLPRPDAHPDRRCANCGDFIDPIDWCAGCQSAKAPCGRPHLSLRKRSDARYCDDECRSVARSSFIRDCL